MSMTFCPRMRGRTERLCACVRGGAGVCMGGCGGLFPGAGEVWIVCPASSLSCLKQVVLVATGCTCKVISPSSGVSQATGLGSYHLSFCSFCKAFWKDDASQFFRHLWQCSWALSG